MRGRRGAWIAMALVLAVPFGAVYGCQLVAGLSSPKPLHCSNGLLDPNETHVDCGGECPGCQGDPCSGNNDCFSLSCNDQGACDGIDCTNLSNQTECWPCHLCMAGQACASATDCASGWCDQGKCKICKLPDAPCPVGECGSDSSCVAVTCAYHGTCDGGVGDGGSSSSTSSSSSGTGTGGAGGGTSSSSSSSTGTGGAGGGTSSSTSSSSSSTGSQGDAGPCTAPACLCTNGKKDPGETDTDCGGLVCPKCAKGATCLVSGDCASNLCDLGTCN